MVEVMEENTGPSCIIIQMHTYN